MRATRELRPAATRPGPDRPDSPRRAEIAAGIAREAACDGSAAVLGHPRPGAPGQARCPGASGRCRIDPPLTRPERTGAVCYPIRPSVP